MSKKNSTFEALEHCGLTCRKRQSHSTMIRVLHILAELNPSGAETMLKTAGSEWDQHRVSCEVLSTGAAPGIFADKLERAGYVIHYIAFKRSPLFFWRVFRLLRIGHYDVVHIHREGASFWLGLTAVAVQSTRVIRTIHSNFEYTGLLRFQRSLQRLLLRQLGVIHVAISPGVQKTEWLRFRNSTKVIRNWYDSARFVPPHATQRREARAFFGFSDSEFVLITVGNCSTVKNHAVVIEAIGTLTDFEDIRYLHVGKEQENNERELARILRIEDKIIFAGALDDVQVALYAADVFVMPSLYEGLGIAALEALATGLPAILANVRGLEDLKADYPGIVYVVPEVEALRDAIERLMVSKESQRRAVAKKYPVISEKLYGCQRGVREYAQLYAGGPLQWSPPSR